MPSLDEFLKALEHEEIAGSFERHRPHGWVAHAFKKRNLPEYTAFMRTLYRLPKSWQGELHDVLWPLFQKTFELGIAIGSQATKQQQHH